MPSIFSALNIRGAFARPFYLRRAVNNDYPEFNYLNFLLYSYNKFRDNPDFYGGDFSLKTLSENINGSLPDLKNYYSLNSLYPSGLNYFSTDSKRNNINNLNRILFPEYFFNSLNNSALFLPFSADLNANFKENIERMYNPVSIFDSSLNAASNQKSFYKTGKSNADNNIIGFYSLESPFYSSYPDLYSNLTNNSYSSAPYSRYDSLMNFYSENGADLINNIGSSISKSFISNLFETAEQTVKNKTPFIYNPSENIRSSYSSSLTPYFNSSDFIGNFREAIYKYGTVQSYFRPNSRSVTARSGAFFNILDGNVSEDFTGALYNNPFIKPNNRQIDYIPNGGFIAPAGNLNRLTDKSGMPVPSVFAGGLDYITPVQNPPALSFNKNSDLFLQKYYQSSSGSDFNSYFGSLYNPSFIKNGSDIFPDLSQKKYYHNNSSGSYFNSRGGSLFNLPFIENGSDVFYNNSYSGFFANTPYKSYSYPCYSAGNYPSRLFDQTSQSFYNSIFSDSSGFDNLTLDYIRESAGSSVSNDSSSSEIKIDMSGMNNIIKNDMDIDDFVEKLTGAVRDAADNMAKGVHF